MLLAFWPEWLHEQWTNPVYYNFWSSEAGGFVRNVTTLVLLVGVGRWLWPKFWRHFECDVEDPVNCHRRGHPVHGTGHKACGEHHPFRHDKTDRPTTVDDIHGHHKQATLVARGMRPHPLDRLDEDSDLDEGSRDGV